VKFLGRVSDHELRALYQTCRLFLFPSVYEGIGLPLIEALRCGAPVAAHDNSSIAEFAGSVCHLAPSGSPLHLTAAMLTALAEPRDQRRAERMAHARQFTWTRPAQLLSSALERHLARPGAAPRPRLAWSAPPAGTADLVGRLASTFDIDLVFDACQSVPSREWCLRHRVRPLHEAARQHLEWPYDLFVHHFGAEAAHPDRASLLHWFHGLAILQDDAPLPEGLAWADAILVFSPATLARVCEEAPQVPVVLAAAEDPASTCTTLIQLVLAQRSDRDAMWLDSSAAVLHHLGAPEAAAVLCGTWGELRQAGQAALGKRTRAGMAEAWTRAA
jgi:hypothetical protein